MSDIGAIDPGRWHDSHLSWKIGATSLANVGVLALSAANTRLETSSSTRLRTRRTFIITAPSTALVYHFGRPTGRTVGEDFHAPDDGGDDDDGERPAGQREQKKHIKF